MRRSLRVLSGSAGVALLVAACSPPASSDRQATANAASAQAQAAAVSAPAPPAVASPSALAASTAPSVDPAAQAPADPKAAAINQAHWSATKVRGVNPALVRAEVLLARAHFSSGVIDGQDGGNLRNAILSYERAHSLPVDGRIDDQVWQALTAADAGPAIVSYVVTDADLAGPFLAALPTDFAELAKLPAVGYTSPLEALAEKFHMDEALLTALNPGADLSHAGATLLVANVGPPDLPTPVAAIEVDKSANQVRAFGPAGALLAVYPATVGSTERPAPSGDFSVKGVAPRPTYTYDPTRLTFGRAGLGKLTIQPGPNNPVGAAWIQLSIPTYGIHGSPDPRLVGKAASHGCVRLTNWDITQLAKAVKPGTKVTFVGSERR